MESIKLIVKGNVQRVGYRNLVSQIAFELGVNGFVENLEDESVKITVQGSEKKINEFIKRIKIKEWPIAVNRIEKKNITPEEKFTGFKVLRGELLEEMGERADEAVLLLSSFRQETKENFNKLNNNLGSKMDQNLNETKKLRKDSGRFRKETKQSFVKLDKKYGSVSKKLNKLDDVSDKLDSIDGNLKQLNQNMGTVVKLALGQKINF